MSDYRNDDPALDTIIRLITAEDEYHLYRNCFTKIEQKSSECLNLILSNNSVIRLSFDDLGYLSEENFNAACEKVFNGKKKSINDFALTKQIIQSETTKQLKSSYDKFKEIKDSLMTPIMAFKKDDNTKDKLNTLLNSFGIKSNSSAIMIIKHMSKIEENKLSEENITEFVKLINDTNVSVKNLNKYRECWNEFNEISNKVLPPLQEIINKSHENFKKIQTEKDSALENEIETMVRGLNYDPKVKNIIPLSIYDDWTLSLNHITECKFNAIQRFIKNSGDERPEETRLDYVHAEAIRTIVSDLKSEGIDKMNNMLCYVSNIYNEINKKSKMIYLNEENDKYFNQNLPTDNKKCRSLILCSENIYDLDKDNDMMHYLKFKNTIENHTLEELRKMNMRIPMKGKSGGRLYINKDDVERFFRIKENCEKKYKKMINSICLPRRFVPKEFLLKKEVKDKDGKPCYTSAQLNQEGFLDNFY